jgi:hypothetical protein
MTVFVLADETNTGSWNNGYYYYDVYGFVMPALKVLREKPV